MKKSVAELLKIAKEIVAETIGQDFFDLIDDYKYRRLTNQEAWDRYVIDMDLKPQMNVGEFYKQYHKAIPKEMDRSTRGMGKIPKKEPPKPKQPEPYVDDQYKNHGKPVKVLTDRKWIDGTLVRELKVSGGGVAYEVKVNGNTWRMHSDKVKFR